MSESLGRRAWRFTVSAVAAVFCIGVLVGVAGAEAVESPPETGTTVECAP